MSLLSTFSYNIIYNKLYSLIFLSLVQAVAGQQHERPPHNDSTLQVICTPFGPCEPCPEEAVSVFHLQIINRSGIICVALVAS